MSLCYDFEKWTMITLATVAISLTIGLVLINFAHGQSYPYFEYSSYDLSMVIRYPQNWVYDESAENSATAFFPSSEISFMSNNQTQESRPNVTIVIGKQVDLPYRNMPLDLYFNYTKARIISGGNNITSTGKTNLTDGTPAYEIQVINNNGTQKAAFVIMNNLNKKLNNSESYYFMYAATPDKFNTYLPIAQQVLKTLQICQLTESEKLMHAKKSCLEELK